MKKLIMLTALFLQIVSFAQKDIAPQQGGWIMYFGNHRLNEKWGIHTEYQWRRMDGFQHWQQSLARIGLDYHLDKSHSISAGYGHIISYPYGAFPISYQFTEHRIWQQFIASDKMGRIYFQHRYRLEQRFLERKNWSGSSYERDHYDFRQRARYRFMMSIPLNHKEMTDNTLFFSVYDEVFLGFGKGIGKNILDQNRLYFSLGWRFNSNCNVQMGYLNQYVVKSNTVNIERNHLFQLGITYSLDLRD